MLLQQSTILRIQQWLNFIYDFNLVIDGVIGPKTITAIKKFQQDNALVIDGIFGKNTFQSMRAIVLAKLSGGALQLKRYPADYYNQVNDPGYNFFIFRNDAGFFYQQMFEELKQYGAQITSAGSFRQLNATVTATRSATSMHYIATAFDLHTYSGMNNPQTDAFVIEKDGDYWTVWARCNDERFKRTISNPITYSKRNGTNTSVTGNFINFTAIANKYYFKRIKPYSSFFSGGTYLGAEWWHFQNEFIYMPHFSTFGQELATIHAANSITNYGFDKFKNKTFGIDWK